MQRVGTVGGSAVSLAEFPHTFPAGVARLGLDAWDSAAVCSDPETIVATTSDGRLVPFAVPLGRAAWYGTEYYTTLAHLQGLSDAEADAAVHGTYVWTGAEPELLVPGTGQGSGVALGIGTLVVEHILSPQQPQAVADLLHGLNRQLGGGYSRMPLPSLTRDGQLPPLRLLHDSTVTHFRAEFTPHPHQQGGYRNWGDITAAVTSEPLHVVVASDDRGAQSTSERKAGHIHIYGSNVPDKMFDKLWVLYENTMKGMSSRSPVGGDLSREDLRQVTQLDNTQTYVGANSAGTPRVFAITSAKLNAFPWLRADEVRRNSRPGGTVLYGPIIVADPSAAGQGVSGALLKVAGSVYAKVGNVDMWFECPPESGRTMPMLMSRGFGAAPELRTAIVKTGLVITYSALSRQIT